MRLFLEDVRRAVRTLRRSPEFTLVSLFTLALGIAATTAIFSLVHAILMEPLPYPASERIVYLEHAAPGLGFDDGLNTAPGLHVHYQDHSRELEAIGYWQEIDAPLTGGSEPERVRAARATSGLFDTLGARPLVGRLFTPADDEPDSERAVILGHGLWQRRYGADPGIVGRNVEIGGNPFQVVGVLPADFQPPAPGLELWMSNSWDMRANFGGFSVEGIGRLREGATITSLRVELDDLIANLERTFPQPEITGVMREAGVHSLAQPFLDRWVGDIRDTMWILQGMVGLVLLVACANVANLFLVRAEGRQRETAVRVALGASRAQLVRMYLAESLVLAGGAGLLGLALASAATRLLVSRAPVTIPRLAEVGFDPAVLAFAAGLALVAGLIFGAAPALGRLSAPAGALGDGGRSATAGQARVRIRQGLVAAQVALALLVLLGAGLMARSFWQIRGVEPGFATENMLVFQLGLPGGRYATAADAARFHRSVVDELAGLPGVESAAAAAELPLAPLQNGNFLARLDAPPAAGELPPVVWVNRATAGMFETLEIPLTAGRTLERTDYDQRLPVAVINETTASLLWPDGGDPLGGQVAIGWAEGDEQLTAFTVVGVVADTVQADLVSATEPAIYIPLQVEGYQESQVYRLSYAVRTGVAPASLADSVRRTVWALDDGLPIVGLETMDDRLREASAPAAFTLVLLAIAAGVSLLLGAVGTYGVISWIVRRRTGEIGIRMALGARAGNVLGILLAQGLGVVGVGVAIGLAGSWLLAGTLESLLFRVEALDLGTHLAAVLLIVAVATLATWLPARRAARIEPAQSLRDE